MGVRKSDTGRVPAEKLRVCYTPTPANKLILKKIGPLLEGCVLEALPEEKEERRTLLEQITSLRNTIFIWGDGTQHDDSFFYTTRTAIRMKINLDPHPDEHEGDDDGSGMDFETLRPKIESLKYINFGNHMTYTERSGVDIFTSASHLRNTRFVKALIREITGISMHSLLAKSRRLVAGFHGDIALTIDNDLLKGFPVRSEFIHPRFSVTAAQVVSLLEDEDFMRKISMLDMGGLVHEIPDFNLREDIRLDKPPSMKAMIEFVRIGKEPGAGFTDSQKGMIDAIGSYVAMYHMRAINAYAMAHALP